MPSNEGRTEYLTEQLPPFRCSASMHFFSEPSERLINSTYCLNEVGRTFSVLNLEIQCSYSLRDQQSI